MSNTSSSEKKSKRFSTPGISVIVPVYNTEEYLEECINSILEQNIHIEIILINDGSTDSSGDIINSYCNKHDKIKAIHQSNQGLSATRNNGLKIATGEYIAFLDSDDWLKKDSLSALYDTAKNDDADIVMGNVLYCYPSEEAYNPSPKVDESKNNIVFPGGKCFSELIKIRDYYPMVFKFIYKREWLIRSGFQFKNLLHEDELWTPVVLCSAERAIIINHDFYCYRQREGSIMNTLNPQKRVSAILDICHDLTDFANKNYQQKPAVFSWLYVKIYQLYRIAFETLLKIHSSEYKLPVHNFFVFPEICDMIEDEPRRICNYFFRNAEVLLNEYKNSILSPWFDIKYNPVIDIRKTLIVIYNTMWKEPFPLLPEEVPQDCIITTDRKYLSAADAVVFHIPTLFNELEGDLEKPENQIWIAWSLECEENYPVLKNPKFMDLFDMRMSYHQNADIIYPYYEYGYFKTMETRIPVSEKINKCCMVISSRFNKSKRIEYLEELMRHTEIDSFGKLFNNSTITNDNGRKTKLELYSKYKFVISFENSIANDYVTEKFFDPLLAGTVPVYSGATNITEYAPGDNCFIDIRTFENPRQLADFMNRCYKDDTLYSQFYNWTNQPLSASLNEKIEKQKINPFITLCNKVKEKKLEQAQNNSDNED